jgi:SAM-dependent methyltransferase
MIGHLGERVITAAGLRPGERVLDVGCGAGQLTTQAAAAVGDSGRVVGADISTELLAVTQRRADAAGLKQVEVLEADAQVHSFPAAAYDAVISRFGVMFFADPVAAFRNLRAATAVGGRLAFVCWQAAPVNEWAVVPLFAVGPHVGFPEPPPAGAPGPFAFADADGLRQILADAGWVDIAIEDVKTTVTPGGARTADEAVAFICEDTFGKMLLANAGSEQRAAAVSALCDAYEERRTADGINLNAAVWIVTARQE